MKRLRVLSALLGCLAVIAAGLLTVAWAWAPSAAPATERSAVDEPCAHCPDCDGAPCPSAASGCIAVCFASSPALGVTTFTLATSAHHGIVWPMRTVALPGLSPPPDPLPPRS